LCTTFHDIGDTLTVLETSTDVVLCDEVIRSFIQQPEKLALRSLVLAVAHCSMTTGLALYVHLAFKAPLLHTLELGCKRAPISAKSVYKAITHMKSLRNLQLHLPWVSALTLTL
jgi:hypothetical protein